MSEILVNSLKTAGGVGSLTFDSTGDVLLTTGRFGRVAGNTITIDSDGKMLNPVMTGLTVDSDITSNNINVINALKINGVNRITSDRFILPTAASNPASPSNGELYYNTELNKMRFYNGSAWENLTEVFSAEGGTKTISGSTATHTFTSSGSFVITGSKTVTVTVLGGGGGGGSGNQEWAAGGGGGGFAQVTYNVEAGTYPVIVGAGGAGQTVCDNSLRGADGGNSSFNGGVIGNGGQGGGQATEVGLGGSRSTTGEASTITLSGGGDGSSGGGDGSGGGGQNGGGGTYGSGASGVANGNPGNHATGNGNGGGGGHSCQGGHRGGGDGSDGLVIISYTIG